MKKNGVGAHLVGCWFARRRGGWRGRGAPGEHLHGRGSRKPARRQQVRWTWIEGSSGWPSMQIEEERSGGCGMGMEWWMG